MLAMVCSVSMQELPKSGKQTERRSLRSAASTSRPSSNSPVWLSPASADLPDHVFLVNMPRLDKKRKLPPSHEPSDHSDVQEKADKVPDNKRKKFKANKKKKSVGDVEEGKTVFIRNLSFDTTSEVLKHYMEKFGQVEYALICKDKDTDSPKGTGFVKFKDAGCAKDCNETPCEEMMLDGRRLYTDIALPRTQVEKVVLEKNSKDRDKRNLYLAREGLIYAGSPAAEGVSQYDLEKRLTVGFGLL